MVMQCQRCHSDRVADVGAKCSDRCYFRVGNYEQDDGYVPENLNIGDGDYLDIELCLDCGQLQGKWPLPPCEEDE